MIYFRVDSNQAISGGHVMRCLAIAKAAKEQEEQVCFLIADDNPIPVLEEAGLPYICLHSNWQDLMTDVSQVKEILKEANQPILLIDTYRVIREYVEELKPFCKIAYLGSKPEYLGELDLLINYSTYIDYDFYARNYNDYTKLLFGASYAPLRKEFQNVKHKYRDYIERILITTGNTDSNQMVGSIIEGLLPLVTGTPVKLDIVIGRMFDSKEELHRVYDNNQNVVLHESVKSMSTLMRDCDLAISANGTTVYELSAMGIPTISFAMVEEQIRSAEALSELGVIDYCGKSYEKQDECISRIVERVNYYINNNNKLIELANRAHELIDGNGVYLIAKALRSLQEC